MGAVGGGGGRWSSPAQSIPRVGDRDGEIETLRERYRWGQGTKAARGRARHRRRVAPRRTSAITAPLQVHRRRRSERGKGSKDVLEGWRGEARGKKKGKKDAVRRRRNRTDQDNEAHVLRRGCAKSARAIHRGKRSCLRSSVNVALPCVHLRSTQEKRDDYVHPRNKETLSTPRNP